MAGIFDLLTGDPTGQILQRLGQYPGQPGSTAGPMPLPGPQPGAGGPPGGGPPPGPPGASGPPGAAPGGPTPQQQQMGQTQAYTSPTDLVSMYMQLAQHQQLSESFNRNLGLLAASAYPGRRPDIIMRAMTGQTQDPGELMGNIVKLQQFGQQQAQQQAFIRSAPDIAKQLNLTPDEVLAAGPTAINTAIQANAPPEAMRNWTYAKRQWIATHPDDPTGAKFEQQFPMSMAIVGSIPGISDVSKQRMLALQDWQSKNAGQTPPSYLTNDQEFGDYHKDMGDAQHNFSAFNTQSQQALDTIARLKTNPNLGNALKVMSTTGGIGSDFATQYGLMDQKTKEAIDDIKLLGGQVYTEGFKSTGSRRTQQEVSAIVAGLSKVGNYGETDYLGNVLKPLEDRVNEGMAANYGGAAQLDAVPDALKPALARSASIYLPGGSLYNGSGGKGWYLKGMSKADADAAYDQLPSGAVYIDTDGRPKRKA